MIDVDVADYWSLDTHDPRPHSSSVTNSSH